MDSFPESRNNQVREKTTTTTPPIHKNQTHTKKTTPKKPNQNKPVHSCATQQYDKTKPINQTKTNKQKSTLIHVYITSILRTG